MADEPTPWEDINPTMGLVPRPAPPLPSSALLTPATNEDFRNHLTACLALVVPSGMTEEARREWLAVAWGTLKHLPSDLLERGCKVARETCDHPAKIVPAIIAAVEQALERRKATSRDMLSLSAPLTKRNVMDRRGDPMSDEDTAELNEILGKLGATARYRSDGSRYLIDAN